MIKAGRNSEIIQSILTNKPRVIKIRKSLADQHESIRNFFIDIDSISGFHSNKNNLNHHFFRYRFHKEIIYIFLDEKGGAIRFCDFDNRKMVYLLGTKEDNYNSVKRILLDCKDVSTYIDAGNKIKSRRKYTWFVLATATIISYVFYLMKIMPESLLGFSFILIALTLSLQDCMDVYIKRFEFIKYDKSLFVLRILEKVVITLLYANFVLILWLKAFNAYSSVMHLIAFLATLGTILIKYDTIKKKRLN